MFLAYHLITQNTIPLKEKNIPFNHLSKNILIENIGTIGFEDAPKSRRTACSIVSGVA